MQLVTVFSAFNPGEADVFFGRLEVAGFHPVITHGSNAQGLDIATGGVLVQVPEDEAVEARELLNSSDDAPSA
jgi:hypothetical protein